MAILTTAVCAVIGVGLWGPPLFEAAWAVLVPAPPQVIAKSPPVLSIAGVPSVMGKYDAEHGGLDLAVPPGSPVLAPDRSRVVIAERGPRVCHDGSQRLEAHVSLVRAGAVYSFMNLDEILVSEGERVRAGQLIATSGGGAGCWRTTNLHLKVLTPGRDGLENIDPESVVWPRPMSTWVVSPPLPGGHASRCRR